MWQSIIIQLPSTLTYPLMIWQHAGIARRVWLHQESQEQFIMECIVRIYDWANVFRGKCQIWSIILALCMCFSRRIPTMLLFFFECGHTSIMRAINIFFMTYTQLLDLTKIGYKTIIYDLFSEIEIHEMFPFVNKVTSHSINWDSIVCEP